MTCKSMRVSCQPAVRVRPRAPRSPCSHTRAFALRFHTCFLAGRSPLSHPARPGRASPAPPAARTAARGGASAGPALGALQQGRTRRAWCPGYPAVSAARVSEPAPRFCPRAAPGSQFPRVGFGGRDPCSEACPRLPSWRGCSKEDVFQGGEGWGGGRAA